ncbi:MAG TPA: Uma2 family endonuclease [Pyrinomonadaceae bacterium]|nr:Uma2 family endonuclease [Pyrinomonadaceae bacterium]
MELTAVQKLQNIESFMGQHFSFFIGEISDKQFEKICRKNRDFKIEQTAEGELILMPPTLPDSGWSNTKLTKRTEIWSDFHKSGIVFDSSTYFTMPNGARRSPDVAWIKRERWESLSEKKRQEDSKFVPDFVIELRSSTDSIKVLQAKMKEYIENGVKLGWLIDPKNKKVYVYRANGEVETLKNPEILSGEDVLVSFELNVQEIF